MSKKARRSIFRKPLPVIQADLEVKVDSLPYRRKKTAPMSTNVNNRREVKPLSYAGVAIPRVLSEGETLNGLIESAVLDTVYRRQTQAEFLARAVQSGEDAKRSGTYHAAAEVHCNLQRRLDARRKQVLG